MKEGSTADLYEWHSSLSGEGVDRRPGDPEQLSGFVGCQQSHGFVAPWPLIGIVVASGLRRRCFGCPKDVRTPACRAPDRSGRPERNSRWGMSGSRRRRRVSRSVVLRLWSFARRAVDIAAFRECLRDRPSIVGPGGVVEVLARG